MVVSFPFNLSTYVKDTADVVACVGKEAGGSGSGFGFRDVEFFFDKMEEADAAAKKVIEKFANYDINIQPLDD